MKRLKLLLGVVFIAIMSLNTTSCSDGHSSKIVGVWYDEDDPEDITIFNVDGTGMTVWPDGSDMFEYSYNAKTRVLEFIWDDGLYEAYNVWIDGNTLYAINGEQMEIYKRK